MERMNGETLNIVEDNIKKLKEIFPDVFNEDKVDFEKLEAVLGEYKDNEIERYNFSWPGKSKSIRIAQTPSTGTLRPSKGESKNWDTTENLYIEGDNLEVLKLLQKSYYGKVKMIYIDPPYNTGNDFVYKDDFKDNIENYLEVTGQKDSEGNKITTNTEANGRYHSNWLNMMYPRLKLARNLLKSDGVIFISIDEIEYSKLRLIGDEIFGESNHIADFIWQNKKGGGNDAKYVAVEHEYIVMYAKDEVKLHELFEPYKPEYLKRYKEEDNIGKFYWDTFKRKSGKQYYSITCPDGEVLENDEYGNPISWLRSEERFKSDLKNGDIRIVRVNDKWSVQFKQRLPKGKKPRSIFIEESIWSTNGTTSDGNQELLNYFKTNIFDNAKPTSLICKLISFIVTKDDLILDFFSGSATTAEAIINYNINNNSKHKFIMVQLPEKIDKVINGKERYDNICEIAKKRIKTAGDKIKEENKDKEDIEDLDIGFKVFKLDSSNINRWDSSYEQDLEHSLLSSVENIKEGRSAEDILYEILLKYGIDLNMPIEEYIISGKKVFDIGFGAIIACLDNNLTLDVVEGIGKLKEELNPETCRAVFMDNGFSSDSVKANAVQVLKRYNIEDIKSI